LRHLFYAVQTPENDTDAPLLMANEPTAADPTVECGTPAPERVQVYATPA